MFLNSQIRCYILNHRLHTGFETVVGCATRSDFAVAKHAISGIDEYIKTKKIILCVPDADFNIAKTEFSAIHTEAKFIIKKDSDFIKAKDQIFLKQTLEKFGNIRMYGWYIQQFVKLAMIAVESTEKGCSLIWDMDTIPLRPLCFFTKKGETLNCYYSTKYHEEYFTTINRMFGLNKVVVNSFIAQCLPISHKYYSEFISELGALGPDNWLSNLINSIEYKAPASFSEYETVGTYIEANHPGSYNFIETSWKRDAYRDFIKEKRDIQNVKKKLAPYYSFIAIEKPNRSLVRMIMRKMGAFFWG